MKKPIKRVTLLEDVLSDFLEVEGILSKLQIVEALQLTAKQMQLYKEIVARLNELVRDLTNDVAQEHDAA
jgi:SNF2 family DNA or RNA helicase